MPTPYHWSLKLGSSPFAQLGVVPGDPGKPGPVGPPGPPGPTLVMGYGGGFGMSLGLRMGTPGSCHLTDGAPKTLGNHHPQPSTFPQLWAIYFWALDGFGTSVSYHPPGVSVQKAVISR